MASPRRITTCPPPLFGRIEGAAGGVATPHYYLYYYLPPTFRKPLTPLYRTSSINTSFAPSDALAHDRLCSSFLHVFSPAHHTAFWPPVVSSKSCAAYAFLVPAMFWHNFLEAKIGFRKFYDKTSKGPSINYVVLAAGEGGNPNNDLLNRPYLIKKDDKAGRGSKIADFETT